MRTKTQSCSFVLVFINELFAEMRLVMRSLPDFFPDQAKEVHSRAFVEFSKRYQRRPVYIPSLERSVDTAHIAPQNKSFQSPPICFLHGFDSSSFDFREIVPLIENHCETWAVDLVGWGFSDSSCYLEEPSLPCGPDIKSDHLYEFWKANIKRRMLLMGVSLGGAVALDFALKHPEVDFRIFQFMTVFDVKAVDSLILSSTQGYIDGLGLLSKLPTFVVKLGVQILQTEHLREAANELAYYTQNNNIKEAMAIGRLHTFLPGWMEASLSFIRSDGYSLSKKIKKIQCPTLVLWGRQDEVLGTDSALQFESDIDSAKLIWIEDCGHAGHIEKATEISKHLLSFLKERTF